MQGGKIIPVVLFLVSFIFSVPAWSEEREVLTILPGDTMATMLAKYVDKSVTVRLSYGDPLSGTVKSVGKELLYLSSIRGMEFYDAVIQLEDIEAIVIRVRNQ
jgi:hypothetical protein